MKKEEIKKFVQEHKKQLCIGAGIVIGGVSMYLLGSSVPLLSDTFAFSYTPIYGSSPSGRIFVRESMLSAFVAAENWSIYSAALSGLTDAEIIALGGTP